MRGNDRSDARLSTAYIIPLLHRRIGDCARLDKDYAGQYTGPSSNWQVIAVFSSVHAINTQCARWQRQDC
jgi:hypothetical protein